MKTPGQIYKEQLRAEREAALAQSVPPEQRKSKKKILLIMLLILLLLGGGGAVGVVFLKQVSPDESQIGRNDQTPIVLSDTIEVSFRVVTQAIFESTTQFMDSISFDGPVTFTDGIILSDQDL